MQGRIRFFATGISIFLFAANSAQARNSAPIENFLRVDPGIYRGGRPGIAGLAFLKSIGIRTIVNLEDSKPALAAELPAAADLGIQEIVMPLEGLFYTDPKSVNGALAALSDPSLRPIYVHCHYGRDRTGLVVGLFRVEQEGISPPVAYDEMLRDGFRQVMFSLNHYFEQRTGWED